MSGQPVWNDVCWPSKRVDGKHHSWRFDGDDPYVICQFCGEERDAISGRVLKHGRTS